MDILQLVRTLEEFTYEIALWVVFLPKTLVRFAFQPARIHRYVKLVMEKPANERYDEYFSPLLYWLLIGIVPTFSVINNFIDHSSTAMAHSVMNEPLEVRFASILVLLIWPPVTLSIYSSIRNGVPLNRENLKHPFYAQCMLLAPFYSIVTAWIVFWPFVKKSEHAWTFFTYVAAAFLWFTVLCSLEKRMMSFEGRAASPARAQVAALSIFFLFPGLFIGLSWLTYLIFTLNK
jgi:hypothetical protein